MVELKNIEKKYFKFHLKNINLRIKPGTIFGLVGPNGAGKSTIIKILSGLLEAKSGTVNYFGKLFKPDAVELKKDIGLLSENISLFDNLTVREHLNFICDVYGIESDEAARRITDMLTIFDLQNSSGKFINELSMGMKKKTALIGALIHTPKIVILDEPFENIDPISINILKKILSNMSQKGTIIFLSSHILSIVEDVCDEAAIINNGEIVFQSPVKNIHTKIKDNLTKETYQSLEEIFLDMTADTQRHYQPPSWI